MLSGLVSVACAASSDDVDGGSSSTDPSGASSSVASTSTDTSTTTGDPPVDPSAGVSTTDESDPSSSSGVPLPEGPLCSVQVVTHGALFDPLPKGESAGMFPTSVGDALEDYCGCHTLMSNAQNIEHEFLQAPGGTLFLDYADVQRSFGAGTLGQAMADEVYGYTMPPGSCSFPAEASAVLFKWFREGMPDGTNFTPP